MSAFKEISKIAGAFVGVIVGAGFASGQEILQFFTSFGVHGLIGCVVAGLTFVFLSMVFSTLGQRLRAQSHKEVVQALLGGTWAWCSTCSSPSSCSPSRS